MKKLSIIVFSLLLMLALALSANAATKTGYAVDSSGKPTNIKYTLTDDGTLTFEIDPASGNTPSTVLSEKDPVTQEVSNWNKALPTYFGATKVVIGEGITEINGTFAASEVKTVEIPKSLVKFSRNAFVLAKKLECIYVKGTTPKTGTADLTNVTTYGSDALVGMTGITNILLNPDLSGALPFETFKATGIESIDIPAGVTILNDSALAKNLSLKTVRVLGMNTEFASVDVFKEMNTMPIIAAKKGSKAETFAKANGLTYMNIDTGKIEDDVVVTPATETTGYTFSATGKQTNIKWTVTEVDGEKIVTFEIDASATDKIASTVLYGKDPVTGKNGAYGTPIQNGWGQLANITKVVIKEGITKIEGGMFTLNRTVKIIEIPKSLKEISNGAVFEGCKALTSIYVAGNTPVAGTFDVSGVEILAGNSYMFDACTQMQTLKLSPKLTGDIKTEFIKNAPLLTELEIPAGVTKLFNKSLSQTNALKTLTILGKDTEIESNTVFNGNSTFPAIKAKAGSKAETFAKANGYTFIDLDTGTVTQGTRPAPADKPVDPPTPPSTDKVGLDAFDKDACTAYGYITGAYYDTYWVYYQDTKTLKLISNKSSGYNETGRLEFCEDGVGWEVYKNEIEHIEVGSYITKVTAKAFKDHLALKDVKLGKNITQIDTHAFSGCTSLTTIWYDGAERVEGRADFSKVKSVNYLFESAPISEIVISSNAELTVSLGAALKTIISPNITDAQIAYAKTFYYNLQSATNPDEIYKFFPELPEGAVACGLRAGYLFDETTGTLTIYGAGAISDVANYYGGGSKNSPWFSIKQKIKHVVITSDITAIGRYAFTQCQNLETVEIPDVEKFEILNAAFEKCPNLKSIYRAGTEPVEGTLDLRNVPEIRAWTYAYDYLIANVVLSSLVTEMPSTAFEENIGVNLANIYGIPGSFAETFAKENGKTFYDISSNTPQPITCEPPSDPEGTETADTEPAVTPGPDDSVSDTAGGNDTENLYFNFKIDGVMDSASVDGAESNENNENNVRENGSTLPVIIIVAVVLVVIFSVVTVVVIKKKKGANK